MVALAASGNTPPAAGQATWAAVLSRVVPDPTWGLPLASAPVAPAGATPIAAPTTAPRAEGPPASAATPSAAVRPADNAPRREPARGRARGPSIRATATRCAVRRRPILGKACVTKCDGTTDCGPGEYCTSICFTCPCPGTCQPRGSNPGPCDPATLDMFVAAHKSCAQDSDCVPLCTLGDSCDIREIDQPGATLFAVMFASCNFGSCTIPCPTPKCNSGTCAN